MPAERERGLLKPTYPGPASPTPIPKYGFHLHHLHSLAALDFTRFRPTSTSPKFGLCRHNSSSILKRIQRNRINKVLKSKLYMRLEWVEGTAVWHMEQGYKQVCVWPDAHVFSASAQVQTDFEKENGTFCSHCLSR